MSRYVRGPQQSSRSDGKGCEDATDNQCNRVGHLVSRVVIGKARRRIAFYQIVRGSASRTIASKALG